VTENRPLKWEYRSIEPPRDSAKKESADPTDELNELGAEGWELCESITYTGGGTKFLVFKRRLDANAESNRE
jgi:hypothetical protein